MNWDLRKAEQALARGDVAEARVYAWNALATIRPEELSTLQRIAERCDDPLLTLELQRRGVPYQPEPPPEPPPISTVGKLVRASALLVLVTAVVLTMVGVSPSEPGPLEPKEEDPALVQEEGFPILRLNSGIWLVRIGRSERVPLQKLADDLFFRYRLPIGVQAEIPTIPNSALDQQEHQLIGEELLALLARAYEASGNATIIGVTDYEMRSRSLELSNTFSLRSRVHYSVVSTADLGANVTDRIHGNTRYKRTRKLVARNIGFLFFGRPEVDDPRSLFRTQMSGTDDIDALDEELCPAALDRPHITDEQDGQRRSQADRRRAQDRLSCSDRLRHRAGYR